MARTDSPSRGKALQVAGAPAKATPCVDIADEVVHCTLAEQETATLNHAIGMRAGRDQVVNTMQRLNSIAQLEQIREIRARKAFKGVLKVADGSMVRIGSWDDYCKKVLGRDRKQVEDELQNLAAFGAHLLEAMQAMGLSGRKLSTLRSATPDEDRARLISLAVANDGEGLAEEVEAIRARIRAEHADEIDAANARADEVDQTLVARQRILDSRNKKLDEMEQKVADLEAQIETPSDEAAQLKRLQDLTRSAQLAFERLVNEVDAVIDRPASNAVAMSARQSVDFLAQLLKDRARARGIVLNLEDPVLPSHMQLAPNLATSSGAAGGAGR